MTPNSKRIETLAGLIRPICHKVGRYFHANPERVTDAEHEVLIRIITFLRDRDLPAEELQRYVWKTAPKEARKCFLDRKKPVLWDPVDLDAMAAPEAGNPLARLIEAEQVERVRQALARLPEDQAEAVRTWESDKSAVRELAQRKRISKKQVYYRRQKGRASIRARLEKGGQGEN